MLESQLPLLETLTKKYLDYFMMADSRIYFDSLIACKEVFWHMGISTKYSVSYSQKL